MDIDFSKIINKGFPHPIATVYLFIGSDDALKREAVQKLIDPLLDPSTSDFDREDIDISATPLDNGTWTTRILSSAAGMPMFSERRIVTVANIQRLSKEEQDTLATGISGICERSCLVLIAGAQEFEAGKPKGKSVSTKLQNAVSKHGGVVTCDAPQANDLRARAVVYLRDFGKTIDPQALDMVVQRSVAAAADRGGAGKGGDLNVLQNELEKLVAYTGERPQVTRADAAAVGTRGAEDNIFAMLDAVGRRDAPAAVMQVEEMLRCGDKPDGVAARTYVMLARQLRMIWAAKYYAENRIGAGFKGALPNSMGDILTAEMSGLATRQSYLLRSLQDQAKKWSYDQLRTALAKVLSNDMNMKGIAELPAIHHRTNTSTDPANSLRILVIDLCKL